MNVVKLVKYAVAIVVLCTIQVSLCDFLSIECIKPNLVMSFIISVSVISGPVTGGIVGLICGIFIDSMSSGTTIINSLTYMYLAVISGVLNINYLRNNLGVVIMFTFLSTIISEACVHFIHFAIWGTSNFFSALFNPILLLAIYTIVFTTPIYYLTLKLFKPSNREV